MKISTKITEKFFSILIIITIVMIGITSIEAVMAEEETVSPVNSIKVNNNEQVEITLQYDITNGQILSISPDIEVNSIIIQLDVIEEGTLTVTLPRNVIDAKIDDDDDEFFVLADGEEIEYEELVTDIDRTLTITFPAHTDEIQIIGTFVVPEFGTIAVMILAIAIISILVISARSRLSIIPKL